MLKQRKAIFLTGEKGSGASALPTCWGSRIPVSGRLDGRVDRCLVSLVDEASFSLPRRGVEMTREALTWHKGTLWSFWVLSVVWGFSELHYALYKFSVCKALWSEVGRVLTVVFIFWILMLWHQGFADPGGTSLRRVSQFLNIVNNLPVQLLSDSDADQWSGAHSSNQSLYLLSHFPPALNTPGYQRESLCPSAQRNYSNFCIIHLFLKKPQKSLLPMVPTPFPLPLDGPHTSLCGPMAWHALSFWDLWV